MVAAKEATAAAEEEATAKVVELQESTAKAKSTAGRVQVSAQFAVLTPRFAVTLLPHCVATVFSFAVRHLCWAHVLKLSQEANKELRQGLARLRGEHDEATKQFLGEKEELVRLGFRNCTLRTQSDAAVLHHQCFGCGIGGC